MPCTLTAIDGKECATGVGGVYASYYTDGANITAVTFDVGEVITAVTMASTGLWKKITPKDNDTATFSDTGSREEDVFRSTQEYTAEFHNITAPKRLALQQFANCCNGVAIHFMNDGTAHVQGLEKFGATWRYTFKTVKSTPSYMGGVATGASKGTLIFSSTGTVLSHLTSLTQAAIEAL